MILVVEDDLSWGKYYLRILKRAYKEKIVLVQDVLASLDEMERERPRVILLDVLLTGPTGFALINEMKSYGDWRKIDIVIVSSVKIAALPNGYGVKTILDKAKMKPEELIEALKS